MGARGWRLAGERVRGGQGAGAQARTGGGLRGPVDGASY